MTSPSLRTCASGETVNSMVPLWQRKKSDVKREEYDKFYQERFGDMTPPQSVVTVSAEGAVTYQALLFIPSQAPGLYYTEDHEPGLQLYLRRDDYGQVRRSAAGLSELCARRG